MSTLGFWQAHAAECTPFIYVEFGGFHEFQLLSRSEFRRPCFNNKLGIQAIGTWFSYISLFSNDFQRQCSLHSCVGYFVIHFWKPLGLKGLWQCEETLIQNFASTKFCNPEGGGGDLTWFPPPPNVATCLLASCSVDGQVGGDSFRSFAYPATRRPRVAHFSSVREILYPLLRRRRPFLDWSR